MKIRSPLLIRSAARLGVWSGRSLFATLRKDFVDTIRGTYDPNPELRCIYITWHDSLLMPIFAAKSYGVSALISRHEDGSYLADAMQMLGIRPVRGSSSRGGAQALRQLLERAGGHHIFITPDGPRGPRRQMKAGAIYLASQTGLPIVCVGCHADRAWRPRGKWTDMVIPKPFSRIVMRSTPPIPVPPDLNREETGVWVSRIQQAMEEIFTCTQRVAAGEQIDMRAHFGAEPGIPSDSGRAAA